MRKWTNTVARAAGLLTIFSLGVLSRDALVPSAGAEPAHRYPYDPVCAWGRLGDGHGMLVRCLTQNEAGPLVAGDKSAAQEKASEAEPAGPAEPAPAAPPKKRILVELGPIAVDSGTLPLAVKKLNAARDRYVECVEKHGGMMASKAKVDVRFLVRERGRAEGVSVAKSSGVSRGAAKCVAQVVDRRHVGYPAAPIVGATLTVQFTSE